MIVYAQTKAQFVQDVKGNRIAKAVQDAFQKQLGYVPGKSELSAFQNSLNYVGNILSDDVIDSNLGVAIEYKIPQTSKRIDVLLTGRDKTGRPTLVIIELKQWSDVEKTAMDAVVRTFIGGAIRDMMHPSYQAWSYAQFFRDFNSLVTEEQIPIYPCAYLHNCYVDNGVRHSFYEYHTSQAPVFLSPDSEKLKRFLADRIVEGDGCQLLYRLDQAKIRPSKSLTDHLASLLKGNNEFTLIDEQKLCYEMALSLADRVDRGVKNVMIVRGGPGTGKSVVAINLLVELSRREKLVQYATRNSAPREVYQSKLAGTLKKTRIANLFKNTGYYLNLDSEKMDVVLVDEAHRMNAKSGMFKNKGENQIKEIINASRLSVFFLDEDQKVTMADIGSRDEILNWAAFFKAEVVEMDLPSQFRCNGSDGYLAWLDNLLQIRRTANESLQGIDYDFRVCDSPIELRDLIFAKNQGSDQARLVAGYCWDWISKKDSKLFDIKFPEYQFEMQWNLADDGQLWLMKDGSVNQIGCIHTCQGLELGYVGVIIGPDLVIRDGKWRTVPEARSRNDSSIKGYKSLRKTSPVEAARRGQEIVKNTYRTLMTRGQKGCFVWATDPETNLWLKEKIQMA
jgi:DUF2075 family protein